MAEEDPPMEKTDVEEDDEEEAPNRGVFGLRLFSTTSRFSLSLGCRVWP